MSNHIEQEMVQYLLGSLPEAETERFDALSIADAEFADQLSVVENDLVDAYIQGDLSGETFTRFEAHYLVSSSLRRGKVEFAKALQAYGETYVSEASEPVVATVKPERASGGFFAWLGLITNQSDARRWSLALAASVLLAAGAWWIFQGGGSPAIASFVLAPPLRGHGQITTLSIPSRTAEVRIQLQLESDDYPSYRVALREDAAVKELWGSEKLTAASKGEGKVLEVRFPVQLVKSQIYSLVVSGIDPASDAQVIANYPFRAQVK